MIESLEAATGERSATRVWVAWDFLALAKPRLVLMVLVTTFVGFYLGSPVHPDYLLLGWTLAGTSLAAAGSLALNQFLERDFDARMLRTRDRPLPSEKLLPREALIFGVVLVVCGVTVLGIVVNAASAAVTGATVFAYLFAYTPLKRQTSSCTFVGAAAGALPPVTGWLAAHGSMAPEAAVLFGILFFWQVPHSLAIGVLYADDYRRAGFRMLPVLDSSGVRTGRQVVVFSLALLATGLLPVWLGTADAVYFVMASLLSGAFLACGVVLARKPSPAAARRVLFASLIHLPVLLAILAAAKAPA